MAGKTVAIALFVPGSPQPKGRPRHRVVTPRGGGRPYAQVYTPESTRTWEAEIETAVRDQIRQLTHSQPMPRLPISGRVLITARFNLHRPKSTPKSVLYPVKSRSDIDNMEKALYDALQKAGIMANDCQITDNSNCKRFADQDHPEGIEVDLTGFLD